MAVYENNSRGLVREATKTPVTLLKESQGSAPEMGKAVHIATIVWVLHQLITLQERDKEKNIIYVLMLS